MNKIVLYSGVFFMFIIASLIRLDMYGVSSIKEELHNSLQISMRNVLKAKNINPMYEMSEEDMSIELIRNIGMNTNVDTQLEVHILEMNEQGLIDVAIRSKFQHLNGEEGEEILRKTMIVEEKSK